MDLHFDAVIIGGGASGLICAVAAKQKYPGLSVAVIEKNNRVGKKLLATGNGRCNLTNENAAPERYTGGVRAMQPVFDAFDSQRLLEYFKSLGLLTAKDSEGRFYPLCRQASAVLDVLRFRCEELGAEIFCDETIKSIRRKGRLTVFTDKNSFSCNRLVVAAGSKAAPKLGGSGSAADILGNFGHHVSPFAPALCPVRVRPATLKALKGLRTQATVTLLNSRGAVKKERGEVQFTEDALSGICVFNLSLYAKPGDVIETDLLPDISERELYSILEQNRQRFARQTCDNLFTGILQKRVAVAVLKTANFKDFSRGCASVSEQELRAAAKAAGHLRFEVLGNADFDRAQACTGGVRADEIDARTMRSKIFPNLSVCGEAIDICGECGGYNLHFAFASGIIAGENL